MKYWNEYEKAFKAVVEDVAGWVDPGMELEIIHWDGSEDCIAGWYAYQYDGSQSYLIEENPLISDETAEKHNVRVQKILNNSGVFWSM